MTDTTRHDAQSRLSNARAVVDDTIAIEDRPRVLQNICCLDLESCDCIFANAMWPLSLTYMWICTEREEILCFPVLVPSVFIAD